MGRNDDIDLDEHQQSILAGHQLLGHEEELEVVGEVDEFDQQARLLHRLHNADELDRKVALRGAKHDALNQQAPFSRIQPPSILKGSLGNQVQVANGEFKTVAMWTGDDAETTPVTVTLVPSEQIQSPTVFPTWRPFARVRWGTRGFAGEVFVDIGKGTQFTIACSQIVVDVGVDSALGLAVAPIVITGMITPCLPIVRTSPITRTLYLDTLNSTVDIPPGYASDDTLTIPPFSKRVWIVGQNSVFPAPTIEIRALAGDGSIIYNVQGTTATFAANPVVLPDDAVFFEVLVVGAILHVLQMRVVFELQL